MENLLCFLTIMVAMFLGEWVSKKTHSWIPSIFVVAIIFLIGFWTVFPKDLIAQASYSKAFITVAIGILLVHLGTLMNLKKLVQQWKAVCIAVLGMLGTLIFTLTIGLAFFGRDLVVSTVPTLTGGLVAAALMTQGIQKAGMVALVAYPVTMFVCHHIISFPMISTCLRKEGARLKVVFQNDPAAAKAAVANDTGSGSSNDRQRFFSLGAEYDTPAFIMAKVALVAVFSFWISSLLHGVINANVLCLIFGVVAHAAGFLPDDALNKAKVFNWLMYGLLVFVLAELNATTPATIGKILLQALILIALGLLGMFLASVILAKPFSMSRPMAFACALTALCGFPADYILTTDVVNSLTDDADERAFLLDNMLPKMLVGGFATVSIASVLIASFFLNML